MDRDLDLDLTSASNSSFEMGCIPTKPSIPGLELGFGLGLGLGFGLGLGLGLGLVLGLVLGRVSVRISVRISVRVRARVRVRVTVSVRIPTKPNMPGFAVGVGLEPGDGLMPSGGRRCLQRSKR